MPTRSLLLALALLLAPVPASAGLCVDSPQECTAAPYSAAVVGYAGKGHRVAGHSIGGTSAQILPHPDGCPRRAFCGCGASVAVFGRSIRSLWLAANWFQFPHADPAPGMVAVRRHHVFVIEQVLEGGKVLAYDANSGGHLTRRHVRSLAGFSVRDPHGTRYASLVRS